MFSLIFRFASDENEQNGKWVIFDKVRDFSLCSRNLWNNLINLITSQSRSALLALISKYTFSLKITKNQWNLSIENKTVYQVCMHWLMTVSFLSTSLQGNSIMLKWEFRNDQCQDNKVNVFSAGGRVLPPVFVTIVKETICFTFSIQVLAFRIWYQSY